MNRAHTVRRVLTLTIAALLLGCSTARQIKFAPIRQARRMTPGFSLHYKDYALPSARPEYNSIVVSELTKECKQTPDSCPVVWKVSLDAGTSPEYFFYGQSFPSEVVETPANALVEGRQYRLEVRNTTFAGVLDRGVVRFSLSNDS